jgi:hypothetical protein
MVSCSFDGEWGRKQVIWDERNRVIEIDEKIYGCVAKGCLYFGEENAVREVKISRLS